MSVLPGLCKCEPMCRSRSWNAGKVWSSRDIKQLVLLSDPLSHTYFSLDTELPTYAILTSQTFIKLTKKLPAHNWLPWNSKDSSKLSLLNNTHMHARTHAHIHKEISYRTNKYGNIPTHTHTHTCTKDPLNRNETSISVHFSYSWHSWLHRRNRNWKIPTTWLMRLALTIIQ